MPFTTEIALVSVPMAVYFYVLGDFHGGKHPRVVGGSVDLAWLLFGLSGLVAVGPVGRVVVAGLFGPEATRWAWVIWVFGLILGAALLARTGRHRVVVYHVEPDQVWAGVASVLAGLDRPFATTLQGFEDHASRTSVTVRASPRTRTAVVEAQGTAAGSVATALRLGLGVSLRGVPQPVSNLSTAFFAGASLIMLAPVVGFVAFDPQGRRAIRTLGRWLGWG